MVVSFVTVFEPRALIWRHFGTAFPEVKNLRKTRRDVVLNF
jgi:hypothetical protein